jgi:Family of unknown function (DUF6492)
LLQVYMTIWEKKNNFFKFTWSNEFREIVDYMQPNNPLARDSVQRLSVAILCHQKDLDLLPICIKGVIDNIEDDLEEIVIVSPAPIDVDNLTEGISVRNLLDAEFINDELVAEIKRKFGKLQFTWVLQQVVKIRVALSLNVEYLLILDSDTILTHPRKFAGESRQILSISYEYHSPYIRHYERFKPAHKQLGLSFVTHHQIWQGDIVGKIWGGSGLDDWLGLADGSSPNSLSEYHTYGTFLINEFPNRFVWARWGNRPISKSKDFLNLNMDTESVDLKWGRSNSISVHNYS